jgi:CheY-like chemotaxis protein
MQGMGKEIIIVDDDQLVGGLSFDLLTEVGFDVQLIRDSNLAVDAIRAEMPRLVILDILMPGIDGLTLLHTIKNDAELKDIKCVMVSGKSFSAEMDRAKEYGADCFVQKPYDVKTFSQQIVDLAGQPQGGQKEIGTTAEADDSKIAKEIKVRVWGNSETDSTPVIQIEALGQLFVLGAGRPSVDLGLAVLPEGTYNKAWVLLASFHPEHIAGLGLFPPLRSPNFELHFLGPKEPHIDLSGVLTDEIKKSYTTNRNPVVAKFQLHQVREESYELQPGLRVMPFYANHPGTTLGYVLDFSGRRIVYSPYAEIYGEAASALQDYDEKTGRIVSGCDLLIHDARYTDEDYQEKKNEGHSSVSSAVEFAAENDVRRLILFNQDPSYDAAKLDEIEKSALAQLDEAGSVFPCHVARDGLTMEF